MPFNYDSHLTEEDEQLFDHHPRSWRKKSEQAADDLVRDLKRRGYLDDPDHSIIDDFEKATSTVAFVASGGELTVPAGTRIVALDPDLGLGVNDIAKPARLIFITDTELIVADGDTGTVGVTAEHPGAPYNVEAGWLTGLEADAPANLGSVTNEAAASGGVNHQLTRVATYRTMELVMMDLMRMTDDVFDARRKIYAKCYKDELERVIASGINIDTDGDGVVSEEEKDTHEHGYIRLRRG